MRSGGRERRGRRRIRALPPPLLEGRRELAPPPRVGWTADAWNRGWNDRRRIPRRAAGGSLGRHSHAAFRPQACGQQRALAGALSAIREQAPSLSLPPRHRTQVKLGMRGARHCRSTLTADGLRESDYRERASAPLPAPAPSAPLPPAALLSLAMMTVFVCCAASVCDQSVRERVFCLCARSVCGGGMTALILWHDRGSDTK